MKIKPLTQSNPLLSPPVEVAAPTLPLPTAAKPSHEEQVVHLQPAHPEPPSSWPLGPHRHQQGLLLQGFLKPKLQKAVENAFPLEMELCEPLPTHKLKNPHILTPQPKNKIILPREVVGAPDGHEAVVESTTRSRDLVQQRVL